MFYDLNIPYTTSHAQLQQTLGFLAELSYGVVALNQELRGKLPADLTPRIPAALPFALPPGLRVLRRCTLDLADATQNHRLSALSSQYDLLALRPVDEKTLALACQSLECDIISLDLTKRYPFFFRMKMLGAAVSRGVRIELCYSQALSDGHDGDVVAAARNVISNATSIVRATRGRGIIFSSEASRALACRAPTDLINLACIWGLGPEKGHEAVSSEPRAAVLQADMKRRSFRGVIDVVYGGEKGDELKTANGNDRTNAVKRKASSMEGSVHAGKENVPASSNGSEGLKGAAGEGVTLSKREKKRRLKEAREASQRADTNKE